MERLYGEHLINYLNNEDNTLVWDADGTLCVYAYGDKSINVCPDSEFMEYIKTHDIYADGIAPERLKEIVNNISPDRQYVCTKVLSLEEKEQKVSFITRNYNISEDHIYFVESNSEKLEVLKKLQRKQPNKKSITFAMIDDSIDVLNNIDGDKECRFTTIHVSSFL